MNRKCIVSDLIEVSILKKSTGFNESVSKFGTRENESSFIQKVPIFGTKKIN
jgi:hypothetical protein